MQWRRARLPLDTITQWIHGTYWASHRTQDEIRRSWNEPVVGFCLYDGERPIGCARVVTDFVTVAYLADVLILPEWRGRGLGLWLMESILQYPGFDSLEWLLFTRDAHGLYERLGYTRLGPRLMHRPRPTI
jgi:GNAT superfamily N-acetyltransferase